MRSTRFNRACAVLFVCIGASTVVTTTYAQYISQAQQAPKDSVLGYVSSVESGTRIGRPPSEIMWVPAKSNLAPWECTWHAFGYIQPAKSGDAGHLEIVDASSIQADTSLKNKAVRLTLDTLGVCQYPGGNTVHKILFTFEGKHQSKKDIEDLQFSQLYRVQEGQGISCPGNPVFVGLIVCPEGVTFHCRTVNAENESDKALVDCLDSPAIKSGLVLMSDFNPLIPVVAGLARAITAGVAARNQGKSVEDFTLGLDFSNLPSRARLREGSYVVVQEPNPTWDWSVWRFSQGAVVSKASPTVGLPFNYMVFSISKTQDP
jgi:hypothetical protein